MSKYDSCVSEPNLEIVSALCIILNGTDLCSLVQFKWTKFQVLNIW